jgi:general secretion pathway protein M
MKKYFGWFYALSEREQKMVSVAGIVSVIMIFYFALWAPLNNTLARQQKLLESQTAFALQWFTHSISQSNYSQQQYSSCANAACR